MSGLVDLAIRDAGLTEVLALRRAGRIGDIDALRVRGADLLVLGALADRIRSEEVGDEVRIYAPPPEHARPAERGEDVVLFPRPEQKLTGLELLRDVAVARVVGSKAARIRVDWVESGLELAQVALGFGANELAGHLASKQGLPFADGQLLGIGKKSRLEPALLVKQRELAGFVHRAGRTPVFVGSSAGEPGCDDHDARVEEAT
jgi:hypothetical protein